MTAATELKYACFLEGNLDKPRQSIKKQRHHFTDKIRYNQSYGFCSSHVQMWELNHKKAELWCWRIPLKASWTARRSNQSIQKEMNPKYLLKGLMMKLKLQYFGHLFHGADPLENTLMLGKTEGQRRRGWQRMKWVDSFTNSMDINLSKLQEIV